MSANKSKQTSQAHAQTLRDKLNQSLKQRLSRHQGSANPSSISHEVSSDSLSSTAVDDRSQQFMAEIESEALREVSLIDVFDQQATTPMPADHSLNPIQPSAHTELIDQNLTLSPLNDLNNIPSDPGQSMTNDDEKNESSSLMDILKNSKNDVTKSTSALKSPRQNLQQSRTEDAEELQGLNLPKKDTFLKSPTRNRPPQSQTSKTNDQEAEMVELKTHEKEVFDAISRGDTQWIIQNLKISDIQPSRQEMLLVFSLSYPDSIQILLDAGLQFNPKDGLALRTAIKNQNYAALELLKAKGARIDLDTLKELATWRRNQPKTEITEPTAAQDIAPEKIQSDFDQFLSEHSSEINESDFVDVLNTTTDAISVSDPAPDSPSVMTELSSSSNLIPETVIDPSPEFNDFNELSLAQKDQHLSPEHTSQFSLPTAIVATTQTPVPHNVGRKSPVSIGSSAKDLARLAMLDKVLIEKQDLEMRVLELQMYEQAVETLEVERNRLYDELNEIHAINQKLHHDLAQTKHDFSTFDLLKNDLETQLSHAAAEINALREAQVKDHELHVKAEAHFASLLKDAEIKNSELALENEQVKLKNIELENRKPSVKVEDWLKGTEKEVQFRKNLFISTVMNGEVNLLKKVASNTGADSEIAHIALVFAAESGQVACAQWLLEHMEVNPGFGGEIAMLRAIDCGQHDMVRWLASHGSDIHYAEEFALRIAAQKDDVTLLDFFIKQGANPRAGNDRALREAAHECSWKSFKALLVYGCTGYDQHGDLYPELLDNEECKDHLDWIAQQKKITKTLDPEFLKRHYKQS